LRGYDLGNLINGVANGGAGDGVIDSKDAIFSQLKVWQDGNGNGVSEANELKSLNDLNITAINVAALSLTPLNQIQAGNLVISSGTFTKSDNSTGTYANLDLSVNQTNSVSYTYTDSAGNVTGDYDLNLEVLSLPFIRGYGNVEALPIAASRNESLLNSLKELRDLTSAEFSTNYPESPITTDDNPADYSNYTNLKHLNSTLGTDITTLVENIIFQWTGTDNISPTALRGTFSAQKLAAMEAMRGEAFYSQITHSSLV